MTGLLNIVSPSIFLDYVKQEAGTAGFRIFAIVIRAILGITLVFVAEESRFPFIIGFIALLALAGAVIFAVIPRNDFTQLISRLTQMNPAFARVGGIGSIAFAVFLVYAVM